MADGASRLRGWFPACLAAVVGLALGIVAGIVLGSLRGESLADVTAERDSLTRANEDLHAQCTAARDERDALRREMAVQKLANRADAGPRTTDAARVTPAVRLKFRVAALFESIEQRDAAEREISRISQEVPMPEDEVYLTAACAMSSRRGLPPEDAIAVTGEVCEFFRDDPQERARVAKLVLWMMCVRHWGAKMAFTRLMNAETDFGMKMPWLPELLSALPDEKLEDVIILGAEVAAATGEDPCDAVIGVFQSLDNLPATIKAKRLKEEIEKRRAAFKKAPPGSPKP